MMFYFKIYAIIHLISSLLLTIGLVIMYIDEKLSTPTSCVTVQDLTMVFTMILLGPWTILIGGAMYIHDNWYGNLPTVDTIITKLFTYPIICVITRDPVIRLSVKKRISRDEANKLWHETFTNGFDKNIKS